MRIQLICTAPPKTVYGNRVTATRWSKLFRALGNSVESSQHYGGTICDLLIAMHGYRCADAVLQFHRRHPDKHSILVLTGTDIYQDIRKSSKVRDAMKAANRIVTFEPLAAEEVPEEFRGKVRMIYQAADRTADAPKQDEDNRSGPRLFRGRRGRNQLTG